jgi:hypothetical protein
MREGWRLTGMQRGALHILLLGEERSAALHRRLGLDGEPDRWGVVCADRSALLDGQAWINWRTADALKRRGLVEIDGTGEDTRLRLTTAGWKAADPAHNFVLSPRAA